MKHVWKLLTTVFLGFSESYKLLSYRNISETEIEFNSCNNLSPILESCTKEVIQEINQYDLFDLKYNEETHYEHEYNGYNTICNDNLDNNIYSEYGITTHYGPYFNETDITIDNRLLGSETNLYNVVLHEFLHSLGLDHTEVKGMMNYSVQPTVYGYVRDKEKLYLAVDDYNGMKNTFDEVNEKNKCDCKC